MLHFLSNKSEKTAHIRIDFSPHFRKYLSAQPPLRCVRKKDEENKHHRRQHRPITHLTFQESFFGRTFLFNFSFCVYSRYIFKFNVKASGYLAKIATKQLPTAPTHTDRCTTL